jgi:predicted transposase/invertase (TIGR01784 family)
MEILMKFVDATNDLAFKKIFGDANHTTILISLLNSILDFKGDDRISSVTIANPYQVPKIEAMKETILDINAENQRGEKFIVEMQKKDEHNFDKRSVYYTSKAYVSQLEKGNDYAKLKKVYFIAFINFKMFESANYISRHLILNQETMEQDLDNFEFFFIELKKFDKKLEQLSSILEKWIFFIKNVSDLTMIPHEFDSVDEFKEAFDIANQVSWNQQELDIYEHIAFEEHAERYRMEAEYSKGIKQGLEQGIELTAINMLKQNIDIAFVVQCTGLTLEHVEQLKESL